MYSEVVLLVINWSMRRTKIYLLSAKTLIAAIEILFWKRLLKANKGAHQTAFLFSRCSGKSYNKRIDAVVVSETRVLQREF